MEKYNTESVDLNRTHKRRKKRLAFKWRWVYSIDVVTKYIGASIKLLNLKPTDLMHTRP